MKIIAENNECIFCIKPSGALSTDEPGGMPDLLRGENTARSEIYTVHRLDRIVAGLMVFAKSRRAASHICSLITEGGLKKEYLAIVHGKPEPEQGEYRDYLFRDKSENKTYVVKRMRKGVRDAALEYCVLETVGELSLVKIHLLTGRTHQIRAQFSSRQMPLVGDRKYGALRDGCQIALWSHRISFDDLDYTADPPDIWPWNCFQITKGIYNPEDIELAERKEHRIVLDTENSKMNGAQ